MKFDGKVVIVTGGGSGIGRASVEAFAAEGAKIAVVDRDEAMVRELTGAIGGAAGYVGDVSDAAQVASHATTIATELGPPDVLVTAAGFSSGQALVETDESNWDDIFATNVKGTFLWMKAVLPGMRERGRGAVVTIASQLAFAGGQGNAAYIASKGAIVSLTATAAVEHARGGVRINSGRPRRNGNSAPRAEHGAGRRSGGGTRTFPAPSRNGPSRTARGDRPCDPLPRLGRRELRHRSDLAGRRRLACGVNRFAVLTPDRSGPKRSFR